jgi:uncharacterized membrane protein YqhA
MIKKLIEKIKYFILIPIIILILTCVILTFYGIYEFYELIHIFIKDFSVLAPAVIATQVFGIIDIFILVIILYIMAIGLYELFVKDIDVPEWLEVKSLDQLKAKLASVIIMFLAIFFTQQVVVAEHNINLVYFGGSIAMIMGVLVFYYKLKSDNH